MPHRTKSLWTAPGVQVRIEYAPALLREIRVPPGQPDRCGMLLGVRDRGTVHVEAVRGAGDSSLEEDWSPGGLEPVGIFVSRGRGEVFLREADVERFEKERRERAGRDAVVALVVAGDRAGFFVHERDGSLQSIRSHLEIPVPGVRRPMNRRLKPAGAAAAFAVLASLAVAMAAWRSPVNPPLELEIREQGGALRIVWNAAALPHPATLEIHDGGELRRIDVQRLSSLTYTPLSTEVEVRLGGESAHFLSGAAKMNLAH